MVRELPPQGAVLRARNPKPAYIRSIKSTTAALKAAATCAPELDSSAPTIQGRVMPPMLAIATVTLAALAALPWKYAITIASTVGYTGPRDRPSKTSEAIVTGG